MTIFTIQIGLPPPHLSAPILPPIRSKKKRNRDAEDIRYSIPRPQVQCLFHVISYTLFYHYFLIQAKRSVSGISQLDEVLAGDDRPELACPSIAEISQSLADLRAAAASSKSAAAAERHAAKSVATFPPPKEEEE